MGDLPAAMCVSGFPFPVCLSSGVFEVAEASGVRTGTKIIVHLKPDSREFASEARVRGECSPGLGTCAQQQPGWQGAPPLPCSCLDREHGGCRAGGCWGGQ